MTRLGRWLAEHGITQEAFARKIAAHQTQVSRYVTGDRIPSPRIRRAIEEATDGAVPSACWEKPGRRSRRLRTAASHA